MDLQPLKNCQRCPRLADYLGEIRLNHPDYFARPVPPFGAPSARLLLVGLAPGLHGANATGRPFTGDHAGILLYETLYRFGFSNQRESLSADDGLELADCRITNAVKCLPPQNKPQGSEINECNGFLREELSQVAEGGVVLALGSIAHNAVLKALGCKLRDFPFGHANEYSLPGKRILLDSYHCSRYNTQTKRLTPEMFATVFTRARTILDG